MEHEVRIARNRFGSLCSSGARRAAGSICGVVLILAGASDLNHARPSKYSAKVNGILVSAAPDKEAENTLGVESATKDRLRILVDEELLVQRGVAIGLLDADRSLRKMAAEAVISGVIEQALAREQGVDEKQLQEYYQRHRAVFEVPASYRLQRLIVPFENNVERARNIALTARMTFLEGVILEDVQAQFALEGDQLLPNLLLPEGALQTYLSHTEIEAVRSLTAGESTQPIKRNDGYSLLYIADLKSAKSPSFMEVKELVRANYMRSIRDQALQTYLDESIGRASISLVERVVPLWEKSRYWQLE